MRRLTTLASILALLAATPAVAAGVTPADSKKLEGVAGALPVRVHLLNLQQIGRISDHTRASGTIGFRRSADYVKFVLKLAGLKPQEQVFSTTSSPNSPSR